MASRSLLNAFKRSCNSFSLSTTPSTYSLHLLRPLHAVAANLRNVSPAPTPFSRGFATRQTSSSLNDPNPNWSNRPPKETILLDGCDFEHWLVVMEKPEGDPTRDEIIDSYIKTLATIVGRFGSFLCIFSFFSCFSSILLKPNYNCILFYYFWWYDV